MKWRISRRASSVLACAVIAAWAPGCSVDATPADDPAAGADDPAAAADPGGGDPGAPATAPAITDALTADGCVAVSAGDGFQSVALPDASVLDTVTFSATVDTVGLDAVVALSAGAVTSFNNLVTSVRFNVDGKVDARNAGAYQADVALPYSTSELDFRVIADVTSKTYSVFEGTYLEAHELARQYAFRPGAPATHLDHLALEVDGPSGTLTVCFPYATPSVGAAYSREGTYAVVPLASNQALISDGTTTQKLDATGKTIGTLGNGGELAVDASGNISVARVTGTTLAVDQYTSAFAARWHTTQSVPANSAIVAITVDSAGITRVGLVGNGTQMTIASFSPAGVAAAALALTGQWLAFDGNQPIVAYADGTTLHITRYTVAGAAVWADAFTGNAGVSAMAIDPSHAVIFGGQLFTPINFGGGTLPTHTSENGPFNGFVVKLTSAGAHVFSTRTEDTLVGGIAVNATKIAVSNTLRTQFRYQDLQVYGPSGTKIATSFEPGFGEDGVGGRIALNTSGRVWWNLQTIWPLFPTWPYLVTGTL
ncbi:MAG TPA: hypothetical protein VH165_36720 [Kofleriaceae bacterium]|nr:hypothetical protein [Kofleriaceae bacterium]